MSPEGTGQRIDAVEGQGIAGWVADNVQTVCLNDPEQDPRFEPEIDTIFAGPESKPPKLEHPEIVAGEGGAKPSFFGL